MTCQPPGRQNKVVGFLVLLMFLVSGVGNVRGQDEVRATFSADRGAPLIGEPVRLMLTIDAPADTAVTLPDFPLDWPPFMVTAVSLAQMTGSGGRRIYRQEISVILWHPGDHQTPEMFIEYVVAGSTETLRIAIEPASFTVPSVLDPDKLTLRPLKPLLTLPYVSPLVVLAGAAGVIGAAFGAGRWLKQHRAAVALAPAPGDNASRVLRELQRFASLPAFRAYPLIGDALRHYVEEQAGVPAEEMTTDELLTALAAGPRFTEQHRLELRRILERVDLVKFAQYQPAAEATRKLVQAAARWIESTASPEDRAA